MRILLVFGLVLGTSVLAGCRNSQSSARSAGATMAAPAPAPAPAAAACGAGGKACG